MTFETLSSPISVILAAAFLLSLVLGGICLWPSQRPEPVTLGSLVGGSNGLLATLKRTGATEGFV